jgi:hypothetical protein
LGLAARESALTWGQFIKPGQPPVHLRRIEPCRGVKAAGENLSRTAAGEILPSAFDANNALSVTRSRLDHAMVFANPAQIRVARHVPGRAEDLDDRFAYLAEGACGRIGLEP